MTSREEAHQRFEREKQAYWAMREQLLKQHFGKWVAVVNGQVAAIGDEMGKAMAEAFRKTQSKVMFVGEVGNEDRVLRIRQVSNGRYNHAYTPAIPMLATPVSDLVETLSLNTDFIIDTGADLTVLRSDVAIPLNLFDAPAGLGLVSGVGTEPSRRQLYGAIVHLAGQEIMTAVDCRDDFDENLLGRDVINNFELTLCAKRDVIRFVPVPEEQA